MADTPLLQLRDITKTFGSVEALTDVDFEVNPGEGMALVGDNGAGKSTLVKCIAGTHTPDSGHILFEGHEVHINSPKDAGRLGIEVVYQDLALCDNLDVVQNMYLGREVNRAQILSEAPMEQQTAETLKSLALAKIGTEYVLGWLPRGTHDWNRFLAPVQLRAMLEESGLNILKMHGVSFDPLAWDWKLSSDLDVNYMIVAAKN